MASNNHSALLGAHAERISKLSELRSILTSLNGDNGWLMSFTVPPGEGPTTEAQKPRKAYYHVVFDPWFESSGQSVTGASWLIWVALAEAPSSAIHTGDDVEQIARKIERSAAQAGLIAGNEELEENERMVDAIVISSRVTDHLPEASLRRFDRRIPVVAMPEAAAILKGWNYFQTVVAMKDMSGHDRSAWQALHPNNPLPGWLTPFRLRDGVQNFAKQRQLQLHNSHPTTRRSGCHRTACIWTSDVANVPARHHQDGRCSIYAAPAQGRIRLGLENSNGGHGRAGGRESLGWPQVLGLNCGCSAEPLGADQFVRAGHTEDDGVGARRRGKNRPGEGRGSCQETTQLC